MRLNGQALGLPVVGVPGRGGMNLALRRVMVVNKPSWAGVGQGAMIVEHEGVIHGVDTRLTGFWKPSSWYGFPDGGTCGAAIAPILSHTEVSPRPSW